MHKILRSYFFNLQRLLNYYSVEDSQYNGLVIYKQNVHIRF